jgi:hypothetical protein
MGGESGDESVVSESSTRLAPAEATHEVLENELVDEKTVTSTRFLMSALMLLS